MYSLVSHHGAASRNMETFLSRRRSSLDLTGSKFRHDNALSVRSVDDIVIDLYHGRLGSLSNSNSLG